MTYPAILRATGAVEPIARDTPMEAMRAAIRADTIDTVRLRHLDEPARVMLVDANGYAKGLPVNAEATALYLANCRQGTTHQIRGDVAVVFDDDFEGPAVRLPADVNKLWPFPDMGRAADSEGGEL